MANIIIIPPAAISGVLRQRWIDPLGNIRDLSQSTSPSLFVTAGAQGLGASTYEIADEKYPFAPGKFIRHINTNERNVELPIVVKETSFDELLVTIEDLHDWFATGDENGATPGYFQIIRADNTIRQIACYYKDGLENPSEAGPNWAQFVINLYVPDPAPTEPTDTVNMYTVAQAQSFAIINQGRLFTHPRVKITGPFNTNISFGNYTTGENMVISHSLGAGHYIVIDTRPSELLPGYSVYDDLGRNLINTVSPLSVFWSLASGINQMSIVFAGGTTAATTIELTYRARYRSLYR